MGGWVVVGGGTWKMRLPSSMGAPGVKGRSSTLHQLRVAHRGILMPNSPLMFSRVCCGGSRGQANAVQTFVTLDFGTAGLMWAFVGGGSGVWAVSGGGELV
jgi:hypothetical protein